MGTRENVWVLSVKPSPQRLSNKDSSSALHRYDKTSNCQRKKKDLSFESLVFQSTFLKCIVTSLKPQTSSMTVALGNIQSYRSLQEAKTQTKTLVLFYGTLKLCESATSTKLPCTGTRYLQEFCCFSLKRQLSNNLQFVVQIAYLPWNSTETLDKGICLVLTEGQHSYSCVRLT